MSWLNVEDIRFKGEITEEFKKIMRISELTKSIRDIFSWSMPSIFLTIETDKKVSYELTKKERMLDCIKRAEPLLKELKSLLEEKTEEQA